MKKAILTLVLFTITMIAVAQPRSVFNLSVYGNSVFTVQLDHQYFGKPDRHFSIRSLTPGRHFIKVIKHAAHPYGMRQREIYEGYINIPVSSVMNAFVDRHGRLNVTNLQPIYTYNAFEHPINLQDPSFPVNNYSYDQNMQNCNQYTDYCNAAPIAPLVISDLDFQRLTSIIRSKSFDSTRLQIAMQALNSNYLTAVQVDQLLSMLSFDSSRLELAKVAYSRTIDKQNYYLIYDAFTFESSVNELIQYMNTIG